MKLAWRLAWRYLKGKRGGNAVPVISRISMVALAVGSCALLVLFSIFNGFEGLVKDLYKSFYSDIRVSANRGKFFTMEPSDQKQIAQLPGVETTSMVIEDNVLLYNQGEQQVVTLKGIDTLFFEVNDLSPYLIQGTESLLQRPVPTAIVGLQIANRLGINIHNAFSRVVVFYPNVRLKNMTLSPQDVFQRLELKPTGIFQVQDEFDGQYILAPLNEVQSLFLQPGRYSSLEIKVSAGSDQRELKEQIQNILGSEYRVETRFEQNQTLYMVMKTEKWAVYGILVLVLFIASFNMVGALSLLVLEKKKDIAILRAMGIHSGTLRFTFLLEGVLWAFSGGVMGVLTGLLLCLGQQHFQWVKLHGAFIIEAYPVEVLWTDVLVVLVTVIVVGLVISLYPAIKAVQTRDPSLKTD